MTPVRGSTPNPPSPDSRSAGRPSPEDYDSRPNTRGSRPDTRGSRPDTRGSDRGSRTVSAPPPGLWQSMNTWQSPSTWQSGSVCGSDWDQVEPESPKSPMSPPKSRESAPYLRSPGAAGRRRSTVDTRARRGSRRAKRRMTTARGSDASVTPTTTQLQWPGSEPGLALAGLKFVVQKFAAAVMGALATPPGAPAKPFLEAAELTAAVPSFKGLAPELQLLTGVHREAQRTAAGLREQLTLVGKQYEALSGRLQEQVTALQAKAHWLQEAWKVAEGHRDAMAWDLRAAYAQGSTVVRESLCRFDSLRIAVEEATPPGSARQLTNSARGIAALRSSSRRSSRRGSRRGSRSPRGSRKGSRVDRTLTGDSQQEGCVTDARDFHLRTCDGTTLSGSSNASLGSMGTGSPRHSTSAPGGAPGGCKRHLQPKGSGGAVAEEGSDDRREASALRDAGEQSSTYGGKPPSGWQCPACGYCVQLQALPPGDGPVRLGPDPGPRPGPQRSAPENAHGHADAADTEGLPELLDGKGLVLPQRQPPVLRRSPRSGNIYLLPEAAEAGSPRWVLMEAAGGMPPRLRSSMVLGKGGLEPLLPHGPGAEDRPSSAFKSWRAGRVIRMPEWWRSLSRAASPPSGPGGEETAAGLPPLSPLMVVGGFAPRPALGHAHGDTPASPLWAPNAAHLLSAQLDSWSRPSSRGLYSSRLGPRAHTPGSCPQRSPRPQQLQPEDRSPSPSSRRVAEAEAAAELASQPLQECLRADSPSELPRLQVGKGLKGKTIGKSFRVPVRNGLRRGLASKASKSRS